MSQLHTYTHKEKRLKRKNVISHWCLKTGDGCCSTNTVTKQGAHELQLAEVSKITKTLDNSIKDKLSGSFCNL